MQIPFVGFQPVQSSEHMAALGVFGLCQLVSFYEYAQNKLTREQVDTLVKFIAILLGTTIGVGTVILLITGSNFFNLFFF